MKYLSGQKEKVMQNWLLPKPDTDIIRNEAVAISKGLTTPDYFEYMTPNLMTRAAGQLGRLVNSINHDDFAPAHPFQQFQQTMVRTFLQSTQKLIEEGAEAEVLQEYFQAHRKVMGMAIGKSLLYEVTQLIVRFAHAGWLPVGSEDIFLYTGTFRPFPHKGHIEVAEAALQLARKQNPDHQARLIISTFSINHWKPETNSSFNSRVEQLQHAFHNYPQISIAKIGGDTRKSKSFEQQMLILQLTGQKRFNYVVGSDIFIEDSKLALKNHSFAYPFFANPTTEFYVSLRPQNTEEELQQAITIAHRFGRPVHRLAPPKLALSGRYIRKMSHDEIIAAAPASFIQDDLRQNKIIL